MVLEPPSRPSGDGSRPISRFQEGSMNDRVSAAPPVHFLGPDQLARFERQFYASSAADNSHQRRSRPLSAQAQLPSQLEQQKHDDQDVPERQLRHKKSMAFLNRVRGAFGLARKDRSSVPVSKVQQETEKRISLQHPPTQRPAHRMMKSYSQTNIPHLPSAFTAHVSGSASTDRPSREEILQSYNQLMATGFFQAHAIQSTRQPPPGSRPQKEPAGPVMRSQPLPCIPSPTRQLGEQPESTSPARPMYSTMPDSPGSPPSPSRPSFQMHRLAPPPLSHQKVEAKARTSRESIRSPLKGRKRSRLEADINVLNTDVPPPSPTQQNHTSGAPLSATGGSFGSIWPGANGNSSSGPGFIRRVSKKLRKTPSGAASIDSSRNDSPSKGENGKTPTRLRSPSPASPDGRLNKASSGRRDDRLPTIPPRASSVAGAGGANRLRKKNPQYQLSPHGKHQVNKNKVSYPPITLDKYKGLPIPSSTRLTNSPSAGWAMDLDVDMALNSESSSTRSSLDTISNKGRGITLREGEGMGEPLCIVPDVNRGIPMVPQIPDTFLNNGLYGVKGVPAEAVVVNENHGMDVDWQFGKAL